MIRLSGSAIMASILQLINGILIARQLGAEGRGEYGELLFWAMTTSGLTNIGIFDSATVRLRQSSIDWSTEVTSLELLTCVAIILNSVVLIIIGLGPWAAQLRFDSSHLWEYIIYGIVLNIILMFATLERARLEFKTLSYERIITPAAYCVLLFALSVVGSDPKLAFWMFVAANIPVLILRTVRNRSFLSLQYDPKSLSGAITGVKGFFSVAVILLLLNQIDKAIVLSISNNATFGNYSVAFSLVGAAYSLLVTALQTIVLPSLLEIGVRERRNRIERLGRFCIYGASGMMVLVLLFAKPLFSALFGSEFSRSADMARWIALAMLLTPFIGFMESVHMSIKRNGRAIELHLIVIAVVGVSWALSLLNTIPALCMALAGGRLIAMLLGLRHLVARPLCVRLPRLFWIQGEDWLEIKRAVSTLKERAYKNKNTQNG